MPRADCEGGQVGRADMAGGQVGVCRTAGTGYVEGLREPF